MWWRIGRIVCLLLIGGEFWALHAGEQQLLNLFAVLALGVLAVAWVLSETEEGDR